MRFVSLQKILIPLPALLCMMFFVAITYAQSSVTHTVNVNALIPASPTDFQAVMTSIPTDHYIAQETIRTFQLTYGSYLTYATDMTVEATWSMGTPAGDATPSIEIVSYVPNSASKAYGNTPAVIDTANRKITWSFSSFPGETTDQIVTFQLKTGNTNIGNDIIFTVTGRVLGPGTSTPDSTITRSYRYLTSTAPTNIPAHLPTSAVTPTPTSAPSPFVFRDVTIDTIATDSAGLTARLSQPGTAIVSYGTTSQALTQRLTSLEKKTTHRIGLTGLEKGKQYFFRFQATNTQGKTIASDIYTFTTATKEQTIIIKPESLIISNKDIILHHYALQERLVVIPQRMPFAVQLVVVDPQTVKSLQVSLRDSQTLGLMNFKAQAAEETSTSAMQMLKPGVYAGKLTGQTTGIYDLYVKLFDHNGNITERKIFTVHIVPPMAILEKDTGNPVENAQISLSIYNPLTRLYESINESITTIPNPVYSQSDGIVQLVLPTNRYKAEITATGYDTKEIEFTLGELAEQIYPTIYITRQPFSLLVFGQYLHEVAVDSFDLLKQVADFFAFSSRFSTLTGVLIVLSFIFLTLLSFSARTRIPLLHLPTFIFHHVSPKGKMRIKGLLQNSNAEPLRDARILLIDANNRIASQTSTDKHGFFYCIAPASKEYTIEALVIGYKPHREPVTDKTGTITITIQDTTHIALYEVVLHMATWIMSWSFELLLVISLSIELLIGFTWGFGKAAPFLLLSLFNAIVWGLYLFRSKTV